MEVGANPREFLTNRVLAGPFTREKFDYNEFFRNEEYKNFQRLAIGTMVVTDMEGKTKYVDHTKWPCTNGEIAREYLRWIFETQKGTHRRRIGFNRQTWNLLDFSHPLYFGGYREGELAYIDIVRAFWQLYSVATLDMYFNPWKGTMGVGNIHFLCKEWLGTQRTVRNAIIGIARSREHQEYRREWKPSRNIHTHEAIQHAGPGPRVVRTYNKLLAPELWGYLCFVLHQIAAHVAEHFDLCYVHTDGYIVPASQAEDLVHYLAEAWMMDARIKHRGEGSVYAVGRWNIEGNGSEIEKVGSITNYVMDRQEELSLTMIKFRRWLLQREEEKNEHE